MFISCISFSLCVCLTAQLTSVSYTDPNEQFPQDVKGSQVSPAPSQDPSWSLNRTNSGSIDKKDRIINPHGDPAKCTSCHISKAGGRDTLLNGKNISQICQSCHDGKLARKEIHPVDIPPSASIKSKIPSDFPLEDGKLTCLSCHDIASKCKSGQLDVSPKQNFLRGNLESKLLDFCFRCHQEQDYQPFNVHDQLSADKIKPNTCLWCHTDIPGVSQNYKDDASYALRSDSADLCNNCHRQAANHPIDSHMNSTPSEKMLWHISAYEVMPRMKMPFNELLEYIKAAKRFPRSIPMDKNNKVECYSCHNPHEKGVLPNSNPRSLGAEPKRAKHDRLRARDGNICKVCHYK